MLPLLPTTTRNILRRGSIRRVCCPFKLLPIKHLAFKLPTHGPGFEWLRVRAGRKQKSRQLWQSDSPRQSNEWKLQKACAGVWTRETALLSGTTTHFFLLAFRETILANVKAKQCVCGGQSWQCPMIYYRRLYITHSMIHSTLIHSHQDPGAGHCTVCSVTALPTSSPGTCASWATRSNWALSASDVNGCHGVGGPRRGRLHARDLPGAAGDGISCARMPVLVLWWPGSRKIPVFYGSLTRRRAGGYAYGTSAS